MNRYLLGIATFSLVVLVMISCAAPAAKEAPTTSIKFGVVGPMAFVQGQHAWYGAQIAAEEINEAGGILVSGQKRLIELVKVETNELNSIPDATLAVERAITMDKVDFLVGGYRSEAAMAYHEIACNYKKIFISPPCGLPVIVGRIAEDYNKFKYIFRVGGGSITGRAICDNVVPIVLNSAKKELNTTNLKVAILAVQALWPAPFVSLIKEKETDWNLEIVGEWRPSISASDLTGELTAIKSKGAHIIYTCLGGPVNVVFGKQYGELNMPAAPIGWAVETSDVSYWKSTGGKCNYEATTSLFARVKATDRSIPFYEKFITLSGGYSPTQSAATYTAVWVIKEAIEKANSLDSDVLVTQLEKTKWAAPEGVTSFTGIDNEQPHDQMWGPEFTTGFGVQWQDGELVTFWPPADGSFGGLKFEGVKGYKFPPHVVQYWKGK